MGEMTQGQKLEQEYFRTAGHLRAALVLQIADSLTGNMRSTMVTGDHRGTRVIGKAVTRNALRSRGMIDDANRWTALGWAVTLRFVSEDAGWNPDHFKTIDDVHAMALAEDLKRFPISGDDGDLTQEQAQEISSDLADAAVLSPWLADRLRAEVSPTPPPTVADLYHELTPTMVRAIITGIDGRTAYGKHDTMQALRTRGLVHPHGKLTWAGRAMLRLILEGDPRNVSLDRDHAEALEEAAVLSRAQRFRTLEERRQDRGPGSLIDAADIVTRAVKRAQYDALRQVRLELARWLAKGESLPPEVRDRGRVAAEVFEEMIDNAARHFGLPVKATDA
jgi:hypothetical protein